METPEQKCRRLLDALEEIAREETACLVSGDVEGVIQRQERAAPLVNYLAEHGPAVADAAMRRRVADWLEHRRMTTEVFATHIARMQERLREIENARRRVTRLGVAYGEAPDGERRQFVAIG